MDKCRHDVSYPTKIESQTNTVWYFAYGSNSKKQMADRVRPFKACTLQWLKGKNK